MSASRSFFFLIPANTILVPGMYFLGFVRYTSNVSASHVMPLAIFAAVYENPGAWPVVLPMRPWRFGPTLCFPPASTVWHWAHFCTKIFFPASIALIFLDNWSSLDKLLQNYYNLQYFFLRSAALMLEHKVSEIMANPCYFDRIRDDNRK